MTTGQKIKKLRIQKGMTQKELAAVLNTSQQNLAQYENDKRNPKIGTLKRIAGALNVSINELLGDDLVKSWMDTIYDTANALVEIHDSTMTELAQDISTILKDLSYITEESMKDKILENFSKVNLEGLQKIYDYSEDIAANPKYQKSDNDSSSLEPEE